MKAQRHRLFIGQVDSEAFGPADDAQVKMADSDDAVPVISLNLKIVPKMDGDRMERVLTLKNAKRLQKYLSKAIPQLEKLSKRGR